MLGLVSLAAGLANILVRARPAWAWARSLPWSARHRVMGDTLLIGGALVVLGACLLPLDPQSAAAVLALAAPLAAGAAASTRIGSRRHTSAAGEVVLLVLIIGAPVAFWPWTATLGLLLSPMVFAGAVRRDQRIVATRWEELHHDASGDPAWMSVA
jgi:hypothetical protein